MGYTHYWRRPLLLEAARFKAWAEDVRKIVAATDGKPINYTGYSYDSAADKVIKHEEIVPLRIVGWDGDGGEPEISDTLVSFNGEGDYSHETFHVEQQMSLERWDVPDARGWYFAFCKTARKPYDVVVTASLIRLAYHFPEGVEVSSDGTVGEWEDGRQLCEELFGFAVVPFQDYVEEEANA